MTSRFVYLLWHAVDPHDDDNTKLLGVYSTRQLAADRIQQCSAVPGFADHPDGFEIAEYETDKDEWTVGFVEIHPDLWMTEQELPADTHDTP